MFDSLWEWLIVGLVIVLLFGSAKKIPEFSRNLGRATGEFKRRTKKIGAFPSEQSLLRLVVTIMMDINEEWITGRKYMNMEAD